MPNATAAETSARARGAVPPVLFVLAAALLWSTGGLFIKATPLGALELSFGRALLAALTVAALTWREGFRLNFMTLVASALYAALLVLFVVANKLTTAANAIFLQYTAPVYVLVLEPLLFKERFRLADLFVVAACVAGMSLFFVGKLRPQDVEGNLTALASGVCFALFLLLLRHQRASGAGRASSVIYGNLLICLITAPAFASAADKLTTRDVLIVAYL